MIEESTSSYDIKHYRRSGVRWKRGALAFWSDGKWGGGKKSLKTTDLGFASVVNKNCDDFKLGELSADNFKCLIFAQGLVSTKDAETRRRVLSKLENEPDLTLQKLAEDSQRIVSVRKDSKNIEESGVAYVRKIKHRSQSYSPVKERKNMITQNFNTGRLVTTKKGSFPEVFSVGLGKCSRIRAKFELKENTRPIFRKKRNVLFAATEEINKELNQLVNMGILSKVEFSEWAAPTVYIRKKSKEIRACADFSTGLNAALKDYHYPLPSPEEVFNKLNGGKVFLKIDLSEAYL